MDMEPPLPRSLRGIQMLELLQADIDPTSVRADEEGDRNQLRELAQRQLIAERLGQMPAGSTARDWTASAAAIDDRDVDDRSAQLEQYFMGADGDVWSRYERPDRRLRLAELVAVVEKAATDGGYRIPRRPVVGTLPTRDINAQARRGPAGEGHLVLFDSGLFVFAVSIAGVVAQAINAHVPGDALEFLTEARIVERMTTHPGIRVQLGDLVFSHVALGTCLYSMHYPPPPANQPIAAMLSDGVLTFALAHEYAHVILGHRDVHQPDGHYSQEFAADRLSLEICRTAFRGPLWAYAGALLFCLGVLAMDQAHALFTTGAGRIDPSPTHPPAVERSRALREAIGSAPEIQDTLNLGRVMTYAVGTLSASLGPAFARAHREGYPPAGWLPRSEMEQHAALLSFLGVDPADFARMLGL